MKTRYSWSTATASFGPRTVPVALLAKKQSRGDLRRETSRRMKARPRIGSTAIA
jgi:hypothetical protein